MFLIYCKDKENCCTNIKEKTGWESFFGVWSQMD